jgi:hypothetical protein
MKPSTTSAQVARLILQHKGLLYGGGFNGGGASPAPAPVGVSNPNPNPNFNANFNFNP